MTETEIEVTMKKEGKEEKKMRLKVAISKDELIFTEQEKGAERKVYKRIKE